MSFILTFMETCIKLYIHNYWLHYNWDGPHGIQVDVYHISQSARNTLQVITAGRFFWMIYSEQFREQNLQTANCAQRIQVELDTN